MAKQIIVYVYVQKNLKDKRCEEEFRGANLKFMFSTEYTKSEKLIGELTEDLALFFITIISSWCCFTEYDIILPLILNKETTYEEVMNKYINSVEIDDNAIECIDDWNIIRINRENALEFNSNPDSIKDSIDYETLIDKYRLLPSKQE